MPIILAAWGAEIKWIMALQVKNPEFKSQSHQRNKQKILFSQCTKEMQCTKGIKLPHLANGGSNFNEFSNVISIDSLQSR
jgi:hypothetical protein